MGWMMEVIFMAMQRDEVKPAFHWEAGLACGCGLRGNPSERNRFGLVLELGGGAFLRADVFSWA